MTDEPVRVVHVLPVAEPGGAQRGVTEIIARQLRDDGVAPHLLFLQTGTLPVDVPTTSLRGHYSLRDILGLRRLTQALANAVASHRPHVLHSHLPHAHLLAALAAGRLGCRHLAHLRSTPPWVSQRTLYSRLRRWQIRSAMQRAGSRCVAVSGDAGRYWARHLPYPSDRITTILNGVDVDAYRGLPVASPQPGSRLRIGSAGRLVPNKNVSAVVDAVAATGHADRYELHIAGDGGERSNLERRCRELGVQASFCGNVADMPAFFGSIDVFVLASLPLHEGLPRVLPEAMAAGRAVVATRSEGVVDVVQDGRTGLLVPVDPPEKIAPGLADAFESLRQSPQLVPQFAAAGRGEAVTRFSADRVAAEVKAAYRALMTD